MSYVVDVTLSLVRVLEAAAFFRDERMAGYAANADFWAAEVRHVLDVIAGHESGVAKWQPATNIGSAEATISATDLSKLSKRVKASATRFFRLCPLQRGQALEIEQLLGIDVAHVSHKNMD